MNDALTIATTPQTEDGWAAYYERMESFLVPEEKPYFWLCDSCQAINATVIGAKAFCKSCNSYSFNPQPPKKPVL